MNTDIFCTNCDCGLTPFNRLHINFVFYCRDCFYKEMATQQLVITVFEVVGQFV